MGELFGIIVKQGVCGRYEVDEDEDVDITAPVCHHRGICASPQERSTSRVLKVDTNGNIKRFVGNPRLRILGMYGAKSRTLLLCPMYSSLRQQCPRRASGTLDIGKARARSL